MLAARSKRPGPYNIGTCSNYAPQTLGCFLLAHPGMDSRRPNSGHTLLGAGIATQDLTSPAYPLTLVRTRSTNILCATYCSPARTLHIKNTREKCCKHASKLLHFPEIRRLLMALGLNENATIKKWRLGIDNRQSP